MSHCWEVFLIGQIFFYSGELGANRNVSGKLGMKLAIALISYNTVLQRDSFSIFRSEIFH